jgi:hypothetical protein
MTNQTRDEKNLEQDEKMLKLVKGITRGISPILFMVMLLMSIGQGGLDRLISMTLEESFIFFGIIIMFFGIVWSYQNEIAGGIVVIVFYVILAIIHGKIFPSPILPIFLIIGVLNIYVGLMEMSLRKRRNT